MYWHEVDRLWIARIMDVGDHDAAADTGADIGVTAIDHHLHAVAAPALISVTDERRCYEQPSDRDHAAFLRCAAKSP